MEGKSILTAMIKKAQDSDTFLAQKLSIQFARNVEDMMLKKGLKQKDLAKKMNVSTAYVSKVLNGNINMTLSTMSKIAKALDCLISEPVLYGNVDGKFVSSSTSFIAFPVNDFKYTTDKYERMKLPKPSVAYAPVCVA